MWCYFIFRICWIAKSRRCVVRSPGRLRKRWLRCDILSRRDLDSGARRKGDSTENKFARRIRTSDNHQQWRRTYFRGQTIWRKLSCWAEKSLPWIQARKKSDVFWAAYFSERLLPVLPRPEQDLSTAEPVWDSSATNPEWGSAAAKPGRGFSSKERHLPATEVQEPRVVSPRSDRPDWRLPACQNRPERSAPPDHPESNDKMGAEGRAGVQL